MRLLDQVLGSGWSVSSGIIRRRSSRHVACWRLEEVEEEVKVRAELHSTGAGYVARTYGAMALLHSTEPEGLHSILSPVLYIRVCTVPRA
jgi:hypothetical protein